MICSICNKKVFDHTVEDARVCNEKIFNIQLQRVADEKCYSCGSDPDITDPNTGELWCHGCFAWYAQLNDEGSDARLRKDLPDEGS